MDETWRANAFWILSCPVHADYNHTMQEITVWIATPWAAQTLQSCMPEKRLFYHVAAYHSLICDPDIYSK